jgi:hypothetical protein
MRSLCVVGSGGFTELLGFLLAELNNQLSPRQIHLHAARAGEYFVTSTLARLYAN